MQSVKKYVRVYYMSLVNFFHYVFKKSIKKELEYKIIFNLFSSKRKNAVIINMIFIYQ